MENLIGIDIVEINRIKKAIEKRGERFLGKIYTKAEIEYCELKNKSKYQSYAARFAVKEAVYKIIANLNVKEQITWKSIETVVLPSGKPEVKLNGLNISSISNLEISISHSKEYAVALAICKKNN